MAPWQGRLLPAFALCGVFARGSRAASSRGVLVRKFENVELFSATWGFLASLRNDKTFCGGWSCAVGFTAGVNCKQ
jgi:hypothetical protein